MQSFTMSAWSRRLSRKFSAVSLFNRQSFKKECYLDVSENRKLTRHQPRGIDDLCLQTKFTRNELKTMYRGFKQECPNGIATEEKFKTIFGLFFPLGDCTRYSSYVFRTFDEDHDGLINFEDLVNGLSTLVHGDMSCKLEWIFNLYDLNGDGIVSRDEIYDVISSVYDLLGRCTDPPVTDIDILQHVEHVFEKLDADKNGVISLEEFIEVCTEDDKIRQSLSVFSTDVE